MSTRDSAAPSSARAAPPRGWRRPSTWVALGSVCVAALVAGLGAPRVSAWRTRAHAADRLGTLSRCLFGPSGDSDPKLLRARLIAASASAGSGTAAAAPWPQPCKAAALELELDLLSMMRQGRGRCGSAQCCPDDEPCASLAQLGGVLRALRTAKGAQDLDLEALSGLGALGHRAELEPHFTATDPGPPEPAKLWTLERLSPIDRGVAELVTDPPGDATLALMFQQQGLRCRVCTMDLAGMPKAECHELGAELARFGTPQLLAGDRGAPRLLLVGGVNGPEAAPPIGASGGARLVDAVTGQSRATLPGGALDGYVWPDGHAAVLVAPGATEPAKLVRMGPDGALAQSNVPARAAFDFGPALELDELLWGERTAPDAQRVFAVHLGADDTKLGPPELIGSVAGLGSDVGLEACRTAELLTVLARGEPRDGGTPAAMLFRSADKWQAPLGVTVPSEAAGLTCYAATASLSWIEPEDEQPIDGRSGAQAPVRGSYAIHRLQCTAAGCQAEQANVSLERWSRASRYVFADLGSAVLLLWRSPLGDVRLRIGPLAGIAELPDVPLFDDESHGAVAWEQGRGSVFARAGTALVLVKGGAAQGDGTYALRVGADGEVLPVAVSR